MFVIYYHTAKVLCITMYHLFVIGKLLDTYIKYLQDVLALEICKTVSNAQLKPG